MFGELVVDKMRISFFNVLLIFMKYVFLLKCWFFFFFMFNNLIFLRLKDELVGFLGLISLIILVIFFLLVKRICFFVWVVRFWYKVWFCKFFFVCWLFLRIVVWWVWCFLCCVYLLVNWKRSLIFFFFVRDEILFLWCLFLVLVLEKKMMVDLGRYWSKVW